MSSLGTRILAGVRQHEDQEKRSPSLSDLHRFYLKRQMSMATLKKHAAMMVATGELKIVDAPFRARGRPTTRYTPGREIQKLGPWNVPECAQELLQQIKDHHLRLGSDPSRSELHRRYLKSSFAMETVEEALHALIESGRVEEIPPLPTARGNSPIRYRVKKSSKPIVHHRRRDIAMTVSEAQTFVNEIKKQPCMDCDLVFHPICMDFDHRDPVTKVAAISSMIRCGPRRKELFHEIAKCDVVCANCHRLRTMNRRLEDLADLNIADDLIVALDPNIRETVTNAPPGRRGHGARGEPGDRLLVPLMKQTPSTRCTTTPPTRKITHP